MLQVAAKPSRPPGGRRVADAEVQRRLSCVERLLANGVSRSDIVAEVGLPARTTDSYIARVRQAWQENAQQDRESARARALERLAGLRDNLLAERAFGPAVRVEAMLIDLEGLRGGRDEAAPPESQVPAVTPPTLSIEWLRGRLPLLVLACARLAASSNDEELLKCTQDALKRSLFSLGAAEDPQ